MGSKQVTGLVWPSKQKIGSPVCESHTTMVPSSPQEANLTIRNESNFSPVIINNGEYSDDVCVLGEELDLVVRIVLSQVGQWCTVFSWLLCIEECTKELRYVIHSPVAKKKHLLFSMEVEVPVHEFSPDIVKEKDYVILEVNNTNHVIVQVSRTG
jgi:hypothetical protein